MNSELLNLDLHLLLVIIEKTVILPAFVLLFFLTGFMILRKVRKKIGREKLIHMITDTEIAKGSTHMIKTSFYADGHPDIDKNVHYCVITRSEGKLRIGVLDEIQGQINTLGEIPMSSISNIKVQDINSLKFKAPGSWALSREIFNSLNETRYTRMAILTIEWECGDRKYETRLGIHEEDAMLSALIKRNELFNWFKSELGFAG
jgi:hypothetical protein